MYAKSGNMEDARLVDDRVVEEDVVLITSLIVGNARNGRDADAVCAFRDMMSKGIGANGYTFASTLISCGCRSNVAAGKSIHALTVKSGFVSFVEPQTSLPTMYLKFGMVDDSVEVFACLDDPNVVTWTSLINGMAQNGREVTAISYFQEMLRPSVNPNSHTLSSIIQACSSMAMLEIGIQIHGLSVKSGWSRNLYIDADLYGKCGIAEMARSVFDEFKVKDVVSINSMIHCYAINGLGAEALHLYGRMKQLSIDPNDVTYLNILLACSNTCLVEEGRRVFAELRERPHLVVTDDHYACFADLLGKSGRLEEAEALVLEMRPEDVVLWRVLRNACQIHDKVEMAERIIHRVRELVPRDGWSHVVMSNMYASSCKWDKVIEMRSILKETGLKKDRAMSWVHVNQEVRTFFASDLSHPDTPEILVTLEELIQRTRSLGYVPNFGYVYQHIEHKEQEELLYYHSEKLAIAFALCRTRGNSSSIRILKNLRTCGDCHAWIKLVSLVIQRTIIVRDVKRYHHFLNGSCSCGDIW
ncbi:hypothetical protein MLD38_028507 [Melastoma candidum]|uniref:Uncharacterized protein n=1 Tax=Melastoma candidum TaxID=119954 RepID=A0ACB9N105_9MYRT|nr:hypothetical protein MLD38_028507 [Melastoma candidum]